jgi:UDP-2,3-diacylglucosamine hydrolase
MIPAGPAMEILFLSDLHLSPERPDQVEHFRRLLRGPARRAEAIYLLGDLFEQFWIGNDEHTPPAAEVLAELRACAGSGPRCHILRGNRELMLDRGFEALTGWRVLPDRSVIDVVGRRVLIMHGDLLCTRDWKYQAFRTFMESAPVRGLYRALPRRMRELLSHGLRPAMRRSAARKPPEIVDADADAIRREMEAHGVTTLIHGHTHRPGVFPVTLAGGEGTRTVLGDWYGEGMVLSCRADEWRLLSVSDYLRAAA